MRAASLARCGDVPLPTAAGDGVPQIIETTIHPWRVLHACEKLVPVLTLVEAQRGAGMRPSIVTPHQFIAPEHYDVARQEDERPMSLLMAWNDVRQWRKAILATSPYETCDLVQAHSFASGMAAVRNCPAVVYDVEEFIDELAIGSQQCSDNSWLARSFRVAEQFVLMRACAVVVHTNSMRSAAVQRGAPERDLFVIPEPLEMPALTGDSKEPQPPMLPGQITLLAPDVDIAGAELSREAAMLLEAFALLRSEVPEAVLMVLGDQNRSAEFLARAAHAGVAPCTQIFPAGHRDWALAAADIVIAGAMAGDGVERGATAVAAMARGRALLAADGAGNRDVTPEGCGCLWFRANDAGDLAFRASFLARDGEFRRSLGAAGQRHIIEARDPARIAAQYDAVYRHAFSRRRSGSERSPFGVLQPVQVFR
jgi:hypothetical protein